MIKRISTEIQEFPLTESFFELKKALNAGDLEFFQELIQEWEESSDIYAILNSESTDGWTLIHYSCYKGVDKITEYLVNKAVMCNSESEDSWTPLQLACYNGHTASVKSLLKHPQVQINRSTGRGTALHQACRRGQSDILYLLLNAGACMTIEDSNGLIPLQVASNQEVFDIIPRYMGEYLIKRSAPEKSPKPSETNIKVVIDSKSLVMSYKVLEGLITFYDSQPAEYKTIKIVEIYDLREVSPTACMVQGKFGVFEIKTNNCRDMIKDLEKVINYCHIHKIGYEVDKDINDTIITNLISKNSSRSASVNIVSISNFNIVSKLETRPYIDYYSVVGNDSNYIFVLKQISKAEIKKLNRTSYYVRESKMLQRFRHSYIARLHYAFQDHKYLYMVFEDCTETLLSRIRTGVLSPSLAQNYMCQIILALEYLHSRDIGYRNLNLNSVWIDPQGSIKLMDFELSKENTNNVNKSKSFVGTLGFFAPECFSKEGYEKPADVYALGPCLYTMLTGNSLFESNNLKDLISSIKLSQYSLPADFPAEIKDFIEKVMQKDPNLRPKVSALKKTLWLRDCNWTDLERKRVKPRRKSNLPSVVYRNSIQNNQNLIIDEDTESIYGEIEDFDYYGNL